MKFDKILLVCSAVLFFTMVLKKYPTQDLKEEEIYKAERKVEGQESEVAVNIVSKNNKREISSKESEDKREQHHPENQVEDKEVSFHYLNDEQVVSDETPPSLNELKTIYSLSENHKIDLGEEFEFYISQNTLVEAKDNLSASSGNIVNERWGFVELEKNTDSSLEKNNQFPVVVSKQTATVGYITGELVVPLDKYKSSDFPGVEVLRQDKDLNISFLQTQNFEQLQSLIKKYKKYKEFNLRIKDSHNYPI